MIQVHASTLSQLEWALSSMACLPLACAIVHRIFLPIRELVAATNQIAGGQLDTQGWRWTGRRRWRIGAVFQRHGENCQTAAGSLQEANRKLAQANAGLEANVTHRTLELEAANKIPLAGRSQKRRISFAPSATI